MYACMYVPGIIIYTYICICLCWYSYKQAGRNRRRRKSKHVDEDDNSGHIRIRNYYKVPLWDVPGGAAQDLIEEERPNLTEASNIHARPYNITVLGPSILCSKQPSTWV